MDIVLRRSCDGHIHSDGRSTQIRIERYYYGPGYVVKFHQDSRNANQMTHPLQGIEEVNAKAMKLAYRLLKNYSDLIEVKISGLL